MSDENEPITFTDSETDDDDYEQPPEQAKISGENKAITFTDSEMDDEQPSEQQAQIFGNLGTQSGTNTKGIL